MNVLLYVTFITAKRKSPANRRVNLLGGFVFQSRLMAFC